METLLRSQRRANRSGSVAEIGVHHGKMFIALCLGRTEGEKAHCIDIFSDQHLNLDHSGSGNLAKFTGNLRRFGIPDASVVIRQSSSSDVTGQEILDAVGPVRFFSVDGGHWREIVENDLTVAETCLAPGGIIALDDFHRQEWPDVSAGYFSWFSKRKKPIEPFAIGFNKLYLCEAQFRAEYQDALAKDRALPGFLVKRAVFQGIDMPVYAQYTLPEYGIAKVLKSYLRRFFPRVLIFLHRHFRR